MPPFALPPFNSPPDTGGEVFVGLTRNPTYMLIKEKDKFYKIKPFL